MLPCTTNLNEQGFLCDSKCWKTNDWCRDWNTQLCEKRHINTNDKRVCGNPLVWKRLSCIEYSKYNSTIDDTIVASYGLRCLGKNMECVKPWYTSDDGSTTQGCSDKSDQIFTRGWTCRQHLQQNIEFHDRHFCNTSVPSNVKSQLICTDKIKWMAKGRLLYVAVIPSLNFLTLNFDNL